MSFGISTGDFLAAGTLIYSIINELRDSKSEFQELLRELESLSRALQHVDRLEGPPSQALAIAHIKCAALTCRYPLENFQVKMRKFDKSLGLGSSDGRLKDAGKKAQWAFGVGKKDEINKLRSYLNIHIGTINMQLMQQRFESIRLESEERQADHTELMNSMEHSARELRDVRGDVQAQSRAISETRSVIQTLLGMVSGDITAPLRALTGVVTKVFVSTEQIYNIVLEIRSNTAGIDTRFTYFQAPVKVEDALGRVFPFPSECSVEALDAEIRARFKDGPGKAEIISGNYELFDARNVNHAIGITGGSVLIPGMSLAMAIIQERASEQENICPIPQCRSEAIRDGPGGKTCSECGVWFRSARKSRLSDHDAAKILYRTYKRLDEHGKGQYIIALRLIPPWGRGYRLTATKSITNREYQQLEGHARVFKRISFVRGIAFFTEQELLDHFRLKQDITLKRHRSDKSSVRTGCFCLKPGCNFSTLLLDDLNRHTAIHKANFLYPHT